MRQEEAFACWIEFAACNDFGQNKPHKKTTGSILNLGCSFDCYLCLSASPGNWTQSNEEYWLMRNVTHGVWARIRGFPGSTAGCKAGACLPKLHLLPPAFKSRLKQRRVHFLYIWTLIYEWKHLFFSPWKFRLTSVNLKIQAQFWCVCLLWSCYSRVKVYICPISTGP